MSIVTFLEQHMIPCPTKALLHINCPGCGMQRSFICLLRGDLGGSLRMHPATIPMLLLVLFAGAHLIFKFSKGAKIIVGLQSVVAIILIAFYIYRIYNHQLFS